MIFRSEMEWNIQHKWQT